MAPGLKLGVFIVSDATNGTATIEHLIEADRRGLDVVGIQNHPYPGVEMAVSARVTARVGSKAEPRPDPLHI